MGNDLDLAEMQEEAYNNQILAGSEDQQMFLSMGQNLNFPICRNFA